MQACWGYGYGCVLPLAGQLGITVRTGDWNPKAVCFFNRKRICPVPSELWHFYIHRCSKELFCNMYLNILNWKDSQWIWYFFFYCFIKNAINVWPKTASNMTLSWLCLLFLWDPNPVKGKKWYLLRSNWCVPCKASCPPQQSCPRKSTERAEPALSFCRWVVWATSVQNLMLPHQPVLDSVRSSHLGLIAVATLCLLGNRSRLLLPSSKQSWKISAGTYWKARSEEYPETLINLPSPCRCKRRASGEADDDNPWVISDPGKHEVQGFALVLLSTGCVSL